MLVWVAVALRLHQSNRAFLAGLVLSLCLAKFHFLVFLPLVIVAQRRWRFGVGFLSGAAALVALSFAVQGPSWPGDYLHMLLYGTSQPWARFMYNFRSVFWKFPHAIEWHIAGSVLVTILIAVIAWRGRFEIALGSALLGALMVSLHVFDQDYVLALPLLILVSEHLADMQPAALLLGIPFVYLWIQAVIIVSFVLLVWIAVQATRPSTAAYITSRSHPREHCTQL